VNADYWPIESLLILAFLKVAHAWGVERLLLAHSGHSDLSKNEFFIRVLIRKADIFNGCVAIDLYVSNPLG
jgi:hypothetical protein